MTDQADALAGKLYEAGKEYNDAQGLGDYVLSYHALSEDDYARSEFAAIAAAATAHFAEEIAEIHRCWKIDQDHIQKELRPQIATLAAENERLKKLDATCPRCRELEQELQRVREGLTRENLVQVLMARYPRAETMYYDMADAILALLAPEGKG